MPRPRRHQRRINRRTVIWIGAGAVSALVLPFLILGVLIATMDPNAYRGRIEAAARQALGRDLHIRGDITLSSTFSPALLASDVTLDNVPGGSRSDMLRIEQMELQIAPRALLTGRFVIARAILTQADLLLETNADGVGNWDFHPESGEASSNVQLQTMNLRDGRVTWRDGRTGAVMVFDVRRISATTATRESPVLITGDIGIGRQRLQFVGQTGPFLRLLDRNATTPWGVFVTLESAGAKLTVAGSVARPMEGRGYSVRVDAAVADLSALAWLTPIKLPAVRNLTFSGRILDIGQAFPDLSAVTIQAGQTNLDRISPGFALDAVRIDMPRLTEPVLVIVDGSFAGAPLRVRGTIGAPSLLLPGSVGTQAFVLDLTAEAAGASIAVRGAITSPATRSGMVIAVGARIPDLSALQPLVGRPVPALRGIAFSANLVDRAGDFASAVTLKDLVLTLPQGDVAGTVQLQLADRLAVSADLVSTRLDADQLSALIGAALAGEIGAIGFREPPRALDALAPPQPRRTNTVIPDTGPPWDMLGASETDLRLRVAELLVGGATYRDVIGHAVLRDRRLLVEPLNATLPGGRMEARLSIDASRPQPALALQLHAPGLALRPLLNALGYPDAVTGQAELEADLHGSGLTWHDIAANLDGRLGIGISEGEASNAFLARVLGGTLRLARLTMDATPGARLRLQCVAMRADFVRGLATIGMGVLDSGELLLNAVGRVNLADETLALQIRPMLRGGPTGVAVVRIDGGFRTPSMVLDPVVATPVGNVSASRIVGAAPGAPTSRLLGETGGEVCPPAMTAVRATRPNP